MPSRRAPAIQPEQDLMRLDKWLWAARFYKTRNIASTAIEGGHVRIAGQRCKSGRSIRVGELICIHREDGQQEVVVQALSALRGPASVARTLYEETPHSQQKRAEAEELRRLAPSPQATSGRPTKRERRTLDRWTGHSDQ